MGSLASPYKERATPPESNDSRQEAANLAGDQEPPTLAALYLRNREVMLRAARAILRNHHDAEDAVSAAVVKVAARLANGHLPDEPDAYLVQSVRNAALDQLRTSARRKGHQSDDRLDSEAGRRGPGHSQAVTSIADGTPAAVDLIIERQRSVEVQAAVQHTLDGLAEREGTMLAMLLAGHRRVDIGARFNLTGQRVGQLLKNPIADLLAELGIYPSDRRPRRTPGEGQ